jgi:CHAD domain-containing protein
MAPARPIHDLHCDESFRRSAGKVIWTRFEEMMSYRDDALGPDPEGIHDMRVASRRLRAAIELFRDVFPRRRLRPLLRQVKDLADSLGEVRDLDVMIERLEKDMKRHPPPQRLVLRELVAEMTTGRKEARDRLEASIQGLEDVDFSRRFLSFVAVETL